MAARGSILYFLIVEMSKVNVMYQTALRQFLTLYDDAISKSKPTHIIEKRIVNIEDYLTKSVWKYTSRGLYEKHKFLFTLLLALKIDLSTEKITYQEFLIFLKGGASLDLASVKPKPFRWMLDIIYLNLVELCNLETFKDLMGLTMANDKVWKTWCDTEQPEEEVTPCGLDGKLTIFSKLMLIRCLCPDRILAQARKYVEDSLGAEFLDSRSLDLTELVEETERKCPLVALISTGSDPCGLVESLARSREQEYHQISMGQGQEDRARKAITSAILKGHWLMLQNCHLCLEFCEELIVTMVDTDEMHRNFKLWLTTDFHKDFPIGLLQVIKIKPGQASN